MSTEATANCKYCDVLFYYLSQYQDSSFFPEEIASNAAKTGCQLCAILAEAVRRIAEIVRRERHDDSAYEHISRSKQYITKSATLFTSRYLNSGVCDFEFYYKNELGDPLGDNRTARLFRSGQHRIEDASSTAAVQMRRVWYESCKNDHPECAQALSYLPRRAILIQDAPMRPRLKLVELSHIKAEYAALSYRWFPNNPFKLSAANYSCYQEEIPSSSLPAIFHDAATVCISLNIRYLWIDSLCILQDSIQDWEIESSRMHTIYRNASLVIGASMPDATPVDTGFLRPRIKHLIEKVGTLSASQSAESPLSIYIRPAIKHLRTAGAENPLAYRGWTYQEAHLARRYLLFKPDEMEWKCEVLAKCECGRPPGLSKSMHDLSLQSKLNISSRHEIYRTWLRNVVYLYSGRTLTFDADKLPALSGVANFYQLKIQDEYLAGIWRGDALQGLIWRVSDNDSSTQLPGAYRAPSWTWTSVNAHISYPDEPMVKEFMEVIDAKCEQVGDSTLGRVHSGYITVRAPVVEAWIKFPRKGVIQTDTLHFATKTSWINKNWLFWPDAGISTECDLSFLALDDEVAEIEVQRVNFRDGVEEYREFLDNSYVKVRVYCICVGITQTTAGYKEMFGLVLGRNKMNSDFFHRLGLMKEWTDNLEQPFEAVEIRTITII